MGKILEIILNLVTAFAITFGLLFFAVAFSGLDSNPCDLFTEIPVYLYPLYLPMTLANGAYNSYACGSFMCSDFRSCPNNTESLSSLLVVEFILEMVYMFVILYFVLPYLYRRIRKKPADQNSQ